MLKYTLNGTDRDEYWVKTLKKKGVWNFVEKTPTIYALPETWVSDAEDILMVL